MVKKGIVKEVNGEYIKVQVYKKSACGNCKTCSEGGRFADEIDIKTKKRFDVGDFVSFEIEDKSILNMGFLIYIIPIFSFFAGYLLGALLNLSEGFKILLSFLSMGLCFCAIHIFDKLYGKRFLDKKINVK